MPSKLWLKYENHILNEGISTKRRRKLKVMFDTVTRAINLETATRQEIELFIENLNRGKFKKIDGEVYSGSSKADIKKFLRQFYKWLKGDNEFYPKEISWLKTKIAKDEKPEQKQVIELKDIPKVAQRFQKYDHKMITLLLFDSGFRIQEMMSCKKKDLTWENFEENNKCFWLKCNESKTYTRKIPIPLFTAEIKAFYESSYYLAKKDDEPLFEVSYSNYTHRLKEYSKQVIGQSLTCHNLRHSSATYYAKEYSGNVPLLAQRYGWSYSAKELQTYVRSSGAYNQQGAKISFKNELLKVQEDNQRLKEDLDKQKKILAKLLIDVYGKKGLIDEKEKRKNKN